MVLKIGNSSATLTYKIIVVFLWVFSTNYSRAQDSILIEYIESPVDSFLAIGDVQGGISFYSAIDNKDVFEVYDFSKLLALNKNLDSAFYYLNIAVKEERTFNPCADPAFLSLIGDKRWIDIEKAVVNNAKFIEGNFTNDSLALKLWHMLALDQAYYFEMNIVKNKIGKANLVFQTFIEIKKVINAKNLQLLKNIMQEFGWPAPLAVGSTGSMAAFLVIQHSDDLKAQKEVLAILLHSCESNEIDCRNYAYLYDRIAVNEGKSQLYGTQVIFKEETKKYELLPVENIEGLENRRKKFHLEPIRDYLNSFRY